MLQLRRRTLVLRSSQEIPEPVELVYDASMLLGGVMNRETRPGLESGWIGECRDATFVHLVEVRGLEEDGLLETLT